MGIFISFISALFIGILLMPILIKVLSKRKLHDIPGGRKIHKRITPSMGGVIIMLSFSVALLTCIKIQQLIEIKYFIVALGIIFILGFTDDMNDLTVFKKLFGQLISAFLVVVMANIRILDLNGFLGFYALPLYISYILSIIIIVVLTNSFNLIDGIDGLAGSLSLLILVFLGTWFLLNDLFVFALISFTLSGSIIAFLYYNWYPAKIFMGDTGSLCIGFSISVLLLVFIEHNNQLLIESKSPFFHNSIATAIGLFIIPIYDTLRVFIRRVYKGKSPLSPDKTHTHHYLLRMGYKHNQITLMFFLTQSVFCIILLCLSKLNNQISLIIVTTTIITLGCIIDYKIVKKIKR